MINLSKNIHIGIIKAQKDYINWSGLGLGHSAEYLIVTNIVQKTHQTGHLSRFYPATPVA